MAQEIHLFEFLCPQTYFLGLHSFYASASASATASRCASISHLHASVHYPFARLFARLLARLPVCHSSILRLLLILASQNDMRALLAMNELMLALSGVHKLLQLRRKKKRKHRFWVHEMLQKRKEHGVYHHLVKELELDQERFHQYFRMSKEQFGELLSYVEEDCDEIFQDEGNHLPTTETSHMFKVSLVII